MAYQLMFMHCSHVSCTGALVFDKTPKWHFDVVLDFDEFQTWGITMIELVYHVLIIGCVFLHIFTQMYLVMPCTCITYAHLMHT